MTHQTPDLTPPSPRRTEDAFARAVRADVDAARTAPKPWRVLLAAPLTAAMALGLFLVTTGDDGAPTSPVIGPVVALTAIDVAGSDDNDDDDDSTDSVDVAAVVDVVDDSDDDTLLALAGDAAVGGSGLAPAFAFADLDGSTEQDLAAVEAALDQALARL